MTAADTPGGRLHWPIENELGGPNHRRQAEQLSTSPRAQSGGRRA